MAEHDTYAAQHPHDQAERERHAREHTPSRMPYFLTFGFLITMTFITVLVAKFNLGPLNDIVALTIAVLKGTAVVLFFMHVRHSSKLTKLTVVSGFLWLAFMIFITLSDYWTRGWLDTFASGR
ncbi:MAG: cytochrome C oxidase subunit IV family protein [Acidobacteria bacterium]|nr:cytochrome C oxidase subunit IV family protein [Acidobacteriota bacterium]